ncbi:MAG: hypothetical protein ACI8QS_000973 [Planctomycetota bacterium]|jgi:hypothetical protein
MSGRPRGKSQLALLVLFLLGIAAIGFLLRRGNTPAQIPGHLKPVAGAVDMVASSALSLSTPDREALADALKRDATGRAPINDSGRRIEVPLDTKGASHLRALILKEREG